MLRSIASKRQKGFSLLELMIAVAIVGILASVAYPAYQGHISKTHRHNAIGVMMGIAARLEQFAERNGTYAGSVDGANKPLARVYDLDPAINSVVERYDFTVTNITATSYRILATPKAGTGQAGNGKLILYSDGRRGWDSDNSDDGNYESMDI